MPEPTTTARSAADSERETVARSETTAGTAGTTAGAPAPLGVAVVGAGYWGPNLVRNFQAGPGFRLRWLCDLDITRAERVLGSYSTVRATDSRGERKPGVAAGSYKVTYTPPLGDQTAGGAVNPITLPAPVVIKAGESHVTIDVPRK